MFDPLFFVLAPVPHSTGKPVSLSRMVKGTMRWATARPLESNNLARFSVQGIKGRLCLSNTNTMFFAPFGVPLRGL